MHVTQPAGSLYNGQIWRTVLCLDLVSCSDKANQMHMCHNSSGICSAILLDPMNLAGGPGQELGTKEWPDAAKLWKNLAKELPKQPRQIAATAGSAFGAGSLCIIGAGARGFGFPAEGCTVSLGVEYFHSKTFFNQ